MILNEIGQQLHDKDTRGAPLTAQERTHLDEWYRQQDAAERQSISKNESASAANALRIQVNQALDQMRIIAQEIQELANANESLRQEITALGERVARRPQPV